MSSEKYSEDSDSSDEDYNPEGQTEDLPSEVESDGDPEDDLPVKEQTGKRSKRRQTKKPTKRRKKATKVVEPEEPEEEKPLKDELTEEEKKKKADSLWADFMNDTGFTPRPKTVETATKVEAPKAEKKVVPKPAEQPKKVAITQIFEFAGEEVKVTKEVAADSAEARLLSKPSGSAPQPPGGKSGVGRGRAGLGGISSVLSQIGKKQKISVLEKSKLDWDGFKKDENLEEELQRHNKGKDGYLERQDFLERADLRRFEIEKEIRTVQRSNRMM